MIISYGVADGGFEESQLYYTSPQAKKQAENARNAKEYAEDNLPAVFSLILSLKNKFCYRSAFGIQSKYSKIKCLFGK